MHAGQTPIHNKRENRPKEKKKFKFIYKMGKSHHNIQVFLNKKKSATIRRKLVNTIKMQNFYLQKDKMTGHRLKYMLPYFLTNKILILFVRKYGNM